jgi:hypothetical protein
MLIKICLTETYSKANMDKYLCDTFLIQNGLKEEDALLPLLFSFAFEYAIGKVKKKQVELKLNGTHQLLVYADDMNHRNLIDSSKEVGLEVNTEKTRYM